jgi:hypothetical protein
MLPIPAHNHVHFLPENKAFGELRAFHHIAEVQNFGVLPDNPLFNDGSQATQK